MTRLERWVERRSWWLAVGLAALFLGQALAGNQLKSLTFDEPSFIGAGYAVARWGDYEVFPQNPPLPQVLAAGAVLLSPSDQDPGPHDGNWHEGTSPVRLGVALTHLSGRRPFSTAFWARLPNILLGAFLVLLVFGWGRQLFGAVPALLAAALVAFSPNVLAHAKVATADVGCALGMLAAVAAFERTRRRPHPLAWLGCGALTGTALLMKYSALLLGPIFVLIGVLEVALRRRALKTLTLGAIVVVTMSAGLIWLAYLHDANPQWGIVSYFSRLGTLYSDHRALYYYYLLGEASAETFWYYYFAALLIKVPAGTLVLLGVAIATLAAHPDRARLLLYLGIPAGAVLLAACFDAANVGVRRVLPALPFLFLLAASAYRSSGWRKILPVLLVALSAAASAAQFPHHLSFINYGFGGPARGPYLLDDSNVDWGQDLPALVAWQLERPPEETLKFRYYGTALPQNWGLRTASITSEEIDRPGPGVYAVSTHLLVYFRKLGRRDWLAEFEPVARAGRSIYIYRFDEQASPRAN